MALIGFQDVSIAFGGPAVLNRATFSIDRGQRVCLVGRNGAGKSTVLKLLEGTITPDDGQIVRHGGMSVARLEQDIPADVSGSIFDVVAAGVGPAGALLAQYHHASQWLSHAHDAAALRDVDRLHRALDAADAWHIHTRVETVLEHLSLDAECPFLDASGGRKRQTLLARALVRQPDVLLLDEPTNHLDIDAVEWMEQYLIDRGTTLVFVTHDRSFLKRVATRIVELDRGVLADWGGDYDLYRERKDAALAAQASEWAEFDRKLAKEEVWIRTGIQARRTRNEGRVRALEALRIERSARRERVGTAAVQLQGAERSGRLVVDAQHVSFARSTDTSTRSIINDCSTTILRGDRVGIIGPNGSGKTTLLRLLLGELAPDSGSIKLGTNLEIAYFDQLREQVDENTTVFDSIADGAEFVTIAGAQRHVHGYLQDFLFPTDRARTPIRALSGGERNRLLLARLFTRQFNLLVLDEPTNDLDLETLDLLEDRLLDYQGTLIVVSHDRAFLDNVVTGTLVFEGAGRVREFVGGYTDWVRQRDAQLARAAEHSVPRASAVKATASAVTLKKRKLSYKETQELKALPERIDDIERERAIVLESLSDRTRMRDGATVLAANLALTEFEQRLALLIERWETLETIAAG